MSGKAPTLDIGDRAPNFVLPDARGTFTMFYERTRGLAVALVFVRGPESATGGPLLRRLEALVPDFADSRVDIMAVSLGSAAVNAAADLSFLVWSDTNRKITGAYRDQLGLGSEVQHDNGAALLLLDANQRILGLLHGSGESLADQALAFYQARPAPEEALIRTQTAPVLLIPRMLTAAQCDALIEFWSDRQETDADRFRDRVLSLADSGPLPGLHGTVGKRLAPELYKAFGCENLRLAPLVLQLQPAVDPDDEAPGGQTPHNSSDLYRVSIALSSADGDHPAMLFPEFAPHRYPVSRGDGLVFSCLLQYRWTTPPETAALILTTHIRAPETKT